MSESGKAVFLSYASQDKAAAQRIADALRAAGVEVWFDQSELRGGDAWDALIRKRIKECALFVPIISATTNARAEGYFRLEWKLAVDRSHLMADDAPFLFPIAIGDVADATARVPDKFRDVQWTRLRLDETPAELGARVAKLLGGDGRVESPARPGERRPRNNSTLIGKLGMIMGLTIGLVFALRPIFMNNSRRPAPKPAAVAPAASAAPVSAARQLVAKAHALFEALDSNRDDFKLAEEIIAQARTAAADDAEVWAADAQLNERYSIRGWDTSDARREAARAATQRAQRLDPSSFEARYAQAGLLSYTGREGTDKEKLLRDLRRERPADHRVLRELGSTIERQGRVDEGVAFMDEAAALPGGDSLALYNKSLGYWFAGRTVEAEAAMRASIAQKPFTGALLMSVWYAMVLHGDLDGARATLEQIAPAELLEDRGCYFAYYLHCLRREPDWAIARLRNMPRDWISDNWYRGPKARLMGDALQLAGRAEAAAVEWRAALKLVDARLAASPTNGNQQFNRILLLVSLGETAEAEKQFAVLVQLNGIDPTGAVPVAGWVTELSIALGRKTEALRQIAAGLKQDRRAVTFTAAILRLDPEYDSLRGDPKFQQLIAQAEGIELASQPPRDWPQDPEVKKAFAITTGLDATMESCRLAEDMVNAVLKQHPTDPEATTVYAQLNNYIINRGYDISEDRYVLARRFAERALQLAPDDPEAMAAMAQFLTFRRSDMPRAEQLIRKAIALAPQESRFCRILTYNVLYGTRNLEALAEAKAACLRFPRDALVQYDLALICRATGDMELMEQALDRALELSPIGSAMIWKGWLAAWVHGDLPGFRSWLDKIGGNFRLNERAIFMRYVYACLSGDANYGLAAVRAFPGSWMNDSYYTGPRSLLLADLLAMQGKKDLAREEYERALAEIRRVVAGNPNDVIGQRSEVWILRGLDRNAEARAAARRLFERQARPFQPIYMIWWLNVIPGQLLAGERADALALLREAATLPAIRQQLRTAMQIDPRMAPFRDDPEIKALLAEPEAKK